MKVKSLSRVRLLATPWTAAYQAPPSMGFSRQEYWSGVPLPSPWQTYSFTLLAIWSNYVETKLSFSLNLSHSSHTIYFPHCMIHLVITFSYYFVFFLWLVLVYFLIALLFCKDSYMLVENKIKQFRTL